MYALSLRKGGFLLLIGSSSIETFAKKQPTARKRFDSWLNIVRASHWKHLEDIKKTYQQTDGGVKKIYTVFNLGSFRVVARVDFETSVVAIAHVFTHSDYKRWSVNK